MVSIRWTGYCAELIPRTTGSNLPLRLFHLSNLIVGAFYLWKASDQISASNKVPFVLTILDLMSYFHMRADAIWEAFSDLSENMALNMK